MRIIFTIAAALGCGVAACGDKKQPQKQPESMDKPVAIVDARPTEAANEADVARYADEVAVDHKPLKVKLSSALVFKSFPKGEIVTTLDHDADVVQRSERYGFYRVTFPDPNDRSQKLMGWMAHFAFEDLPPTKKKLAMPRCTAGTGHPGTVLVVLEDPPRCAYVCKDTAECAATGTKCEARVVVPPSGEVPSSPSYTTACTAPPNSGDGAEKPRLGFFGTAYLGNGKCPKLFAPAPKAGPLCYRTCKTDVQCPEGSTCKAVGGKKLCAAAWNR